MTDFLLGLLTNISKEWITIIIAALPVSELRGAIPLAVAMGFSLKKAFALSVLGNILPVCPILFLLEPVSERMRHIPLVRRFFDWFFERTRRKASLVEKYEALGLIPFVAIPLPVTGAWTGAVAAFVFGVRFWYALPAILAGIMIAGLIVASACAGFITIWGIASP